MCSLRYLGVEITTGEYSLAACAVWTSKLGFEWCIHSADGIRNEIVTPVCYDAKRRGVPAPECSRRVIVPVAHLEDAAAKAAEKLCREDLTFTCKYLGVAAPDGFDKHAPVFKGCKVGFEWALAVPEWDWKEDVSMRVKDLVEKRDIPLPRCFVTRQRLVDVAQRAAQTALTTYNIDMSCTCPGGGYFGF